MMIPAKKLAVSLWYSIASVAGRVALDAPAKPRSELPLRSGSGSSRGQTANVGERCVEAVADEDPDQASPRALLELPRVEEELSRLEIYARRHERAPSVGAVGDLEDEFLGGRVGVARLPDDAGLR